jgi:hypothetical protein
MAWDAANAGVILYGGYDKASAMFSDTWLWKGGRWSRLDVAGPPGRRSPGTAYDEARKRLVVFGGFWGIPDRSKPKPWEGREHSFYGDTWEWDGHAWSLRATTGPAPRYGPSVAYDPVRRQVILFGGSDHAGNIYGDTWAWDGSRWTKLADRGPSPRGVGQFVSTELPAGLVLVGGLAAGTVFEDAWRWDGHAWSRSDLATPLPELLLPTVAVDPARHQAILVGASAPDQPTMETWLLDVPGR